VSVNNGTMYSHRSELEGSLYIGSALSLMGVAHHKDRAPDMDSMVECVT